MCIVYPVVFVVKISLYVYQFPRGFIVNMFLHVIFSRYLHRQCIIHFPVGFILNTSLQFYQFLRDIIVNVSLHVYHFPMVSIDNVSLHVYFPVIFIRNIISCLPFSPWSSPSLFHLLYIIFPVDFIVNISLHVYRFLRDFIVNVSL